MATKPPTFVERIALLRSAAAAIAAEVELMEASNKRFTEQRAARTQKADR
jgi:hypothetical protein